MPADARCLVAALSNLLPRSKLVIDFMRRPAYDPRLHTSHRASHTRLPSFDDDGGDNKIFKRQIDSFSSIIRHGR